MEELSRMVAASMARHGCDATVDHRHLSWSPWFRCELNENLLRVPSTPGIVALAEEVGALADSENRVLAVFEFAEANDLGAALVQLFSPSSPQRERLRSGRCLARVAAVADPTERQAVAAALRDWLHASLNSETEAETESGTKTKTRSSAA